MLYNREQIKQASKILNNLGRKYRIECLEKMLQDPHNWTEFMDIVDHTGVGLQNYTVISQALNAMRRHGIVRKQTVKRFSYYRINHKRLNHIWNIVLQLAEFHEETISTKTQEEQLQATA